MLSLPNADLLQLQVYATMIDNPGPGGAAVVWRRGDDSGSWSGGEPDSTIIRLTMTALIEGLTGSPHAGRVEVLTATKYLVDAFEQDWVTTWRENGWRRPKRGPIANVDLWERLLEAIDARDTPIRWLHGKPFCEEGRRCQRLARKAAAEAAA
ncbi:Ribonuclease H [Planctomycetes bacterium MalM25]|nr:Ribonuclease H [Planctomycetes bacterium MalM25]